MMSVIVPQIQAPAYLAHSTTSPLYLPRRSVEPQSSLESTFSTRQDVNTNICEDQMPQQSMSVDQASFPFNYQMHTNDDLIQEETSLRSEIASIATSLSEAAKFASPENQFSSYLTQPSIEAIQTYLLALQLVRMELQRRMLSPVEQRKRDVLIPMSAAAAQYLVYLGAALGQEFVPRTQPRFEPENVRRMSSASSQDYGTPRSNSSSLGY